MATFYDDFNRADGAVGGNWIATTVAGPISGGKIAASYSWTMINTTISSTGYIEASAHVFWSPHATNRSGPSIKARTGATDAFGVNISGASAPFYLNLRQTSASGGTVLASVELASQPPPYNLLKITWEEGHIECFLNGVKLLEYDSALYSDQVYAGIGGVGASYGVDDFRVVTDSTFGLAVDPNVIPNYGECSELTLTGTGTDWTAGTPGTPTFTVDHGSITAQEVIDADTAVITYCPGSYLGSITFTDPSTGETVGAVVTSDPTVVPPDTACLLDEDGAALLNDTAAATSGNLLTTDTPIPSTPADTDLPSLFKWLLEAQKVTLGQSAPEPGDYGALTEVWGILNGSQPHTENVTIQEQAINAATRSQSVLDELADLRTVADYDLQDVLDLLRGTGDVNHAEILAAVNAIQPGGDVDLQPVLDAISAVRGTGSPDIALIASLLEELSTVAGYNLGHVLAAIAALPQNLTSVLTAISNLSDQLATVQTNIRNDIAAMALVTTATQLAVGTIGGTVDSVLDISEDVLAIVAGLETGGGSVGAPVWPGAAQVTYADGITLTQQMLVTAAMDGVVVDITSVDSNTLYYTYGGLKAYRHIGGIAFFDDAGHVEQWQALGFESAIYTPKTMAQAAGFRLFTGRGASGTITPWTITAP